MANCTIQSYNSTKAWIFGKKPTGVQKWIAKRSSPQVHSEYQFSERYNKVSFSATRQDNCKCCRFKFIEYSHLLERWDSVKVPMTDEEEDIAYLEACIMADLPIDWQDYNYSLENYRFNDNGNFYGHNAIPYDLVGQLCHATKLKWWKPSKKKIWCSKAVARVIYKARHEFLEFMQNFKLVDELRPDQLHMMAGYFFNAPLKAENEKLKKLFNAIEDNSWDLRCVNVSTGGDDFGIEWHVVEHYMAKPKERIISYSKTPTEAIELALKIQALKGE